MINEQSFKVYNRVRSKTATSVQFCNIHRKIACWTFFLIKNVEETLLKRNSDTGVFLWILRNILKNIWCYFDMINQNQSGFCTTCFFKIPVTEQKHNGLNPTSFSSVTSANVRISPWNFLTFSFCSLSHWCKISRPHLVPVPDNWTSTNRSPQKNGFLWSNPCKIEVMITSLTEMLELPNFGYMTTSTI